MKILITGAAGFIGSHTVDYFAKMGHTVLALDNFSTGLLANLKDFPGRKQVVDITHYESLKDVFEAFRPQVVIHLAAQSAITTSIQKPAYDLNANIVGTMNVILLSKMFDVRRLVFSSTSAVYQEKKAPQSVSEDWLCNPSSPYGISKLACEHYIRNLFPDHLILRYGNVYGPRQRPVGNNQVIARAFCHFMYGDDFQVTGSGHQKRDFVYVEDIAYANYQAAFSSKVGTYNAASGKSHSVSEVLRTLEILYDVKGYKWEHTSQPDPRGDVGLNVRAIYQDLNWKTAYGLSEGLTETAQWWKENK